MQLCEIKIIYNVCKIFSKLENHAKCLVQLFVVKYTIKGNSQSLRQLTRNNERKCIEGKMKFILQKLLLKEFVKLVKSKFSTKLFINRIRGKLPTKIKLYVNLFWWMANEQTTNSFC